MANLEVKATAKYVRTSAQKAKLVLDLIRGKSASEALLPRMRSSTSFAFWAEVRTYLAVAFTSRLAIRLRLRRRRPRGGGTAARRRDLGHLLHLGGVAAELPGGRELAELVPDHVLGDVDRDELPAVVDGERVADHLGGDGGPPRPGLHDPLL